MSHPLTRSFSTGALEVESEPDACDIPIPHVDTQYGIRVVRTADLTRKDRNGMYSVLSEYYLDVSPQQFEHDLMEKEWVMLGSDPESGDIWAFSTLMRLFATVDGQRLLAFYSGDTVTRKEYWGGASTAGVRMLVRLMYGIAASSVAREAYWFMISSTYKSYRLLPMLFKTFHPAPDCPVPERAVRILTALSTLKKFAYDPERSIVRFPNPSVFRNGFADVSDSESDPYIRFFTHANSGATRGDRLASLVELSEQNLTALGQRFLTGTR